MYVNVPWKDTNTNTWRGVVDNLESTSKDKSLSANQGKVLKGLVDSKSDSNHTHDYLPSSGGTISGNLSVSPTPTTISGGALKTNSAISSNAQQSSSKYYPYFYTQMLDGTHVNIGGEKNEFGVYLLNETQTTGYAKHSVLLNTNGKILVDNLPLSKHVLSLIEPDNQAEGDIWLEPYE